MDSSGDTVRVRTDGLVPDERTHGLVEELRVGALNGSEEETFGRIQSVIGHEDGGLLVYDAQAGLIRRFDANGRFVSRLGGKGGGPGEYGHVNGIARLPSGGWLVWDVAGSRLNEYAAVDGSFQRSIPVSGTWHLQDELFVDRQGRIYLWVILERHEGTFMVKTAGYERRDAAGSVLDTLRFPGWGVEPALLMSSANGGGAATAAAVPWAPTPRTAFHPAGGLVGTPGGVPYLWYLLADGQRPLRVERSHEPVPVSRTEAAEHRAQLEAVMRRLNPAWNWTGPEIPSTKPAVRAIRAGEDGRVWLQLHTPAVPIPQADLPPSPASPNALPQVTTRETALWDVFASDGRYLGRVRPPPRTRLSRMSGNHAWGVMTDADGVEYAVRFRIEPALTR